jgi:NADH-quinone oxidoreductase subunit M
MEMPSLLNIVTFTPAIGALFTFVIQRDQERLIKSWALLVSVVTFIISIPLIFYFDGNNPGMQFETIRAWIPTFGANYHVGMDGISVLLYLLTTFIMPITILSSWNSVRERIKEFMISILVLETAMLGVFISLDLLLFYVFWEIMLIPMYLIIGVWGGQRRIYAAIKFVIYTMVGSLLMLVAILYLYFLNHNFTGQFTFDLLKIYEMNIPFDVQIWLFLAFALAFAIKVPMFPFHTWLPDAHVEAPTPGSVILAGILLKMGTYGFLRYNLPLFPQASAYFTELFLILALIGILYGAWVSIVQKDVKKLVAYSSVSHLGFIMLGLFVLNVESVQGSLIQMINHGISTGALFVGVGMIYERRHSREIIDFGGITKTMPVFAAMFLIICLSSIGLPGTNGFVGEFLILVGSFQERPVLTILATSGIIFAAVYLLWMVLRVFFGPVTKKENEKLIDLNPREIATLVPLLLLIFWIGIYPSTFLSKSEATVTALVQKLKLAKTEQRMDPPRSEFSNLLFPDSREIK